MSNPAITPVISNVHDDDNVIDNNQDRTPSEQADVCIVGAGPAGALLAHRLADHGLDVVILEAGPEFSKTDRLTQQEQHIRPGMSDPWQMGGQRDAYTTAGRGYPLNAARVKGVGGSTLHWQGMVMRLHERDFEMNTRYDVGVDWPIDYTDLRPYYAAAESALGVAGAIDNPYAPPRETSYPLSAFPPSHSDSLFAPACESLGIDMHSVPNARNSERYDGRAACEGYGTCKPVCPSGAKYTAESHIQKARAAGARVVDQAPVQRLVHNDTGETITKAVYMTPDGTEYHQSAQRFVLACGGVENARLLLLSQSDQHPDGLANMSGAVGRFFIDHLFAGVGGRLDQPTRQNHVGFNTSECHQFYDDTSPVEGIKLEFLNYAGPSPVNEALTADTWGDELLDQLQTSYGSHIAVGGLVEQLPHASNRVTLNHSETDSYGNPVPHVEWSIDERTNRAIRRANQIQHRILDTLGASIEWTVGPDSTGPAYHQMGTTRMGTDPNQSVVDSDCRTHEVSNLWVIGSSVFPTGGAMNPTLTIAALSLRAADAIFDTL